MRRVGRLGIGCRADLGERDGEGGPRLILADARDVAAAAGALEADLDEADRVRGGAALARLADGVDVAEAAGELGEEAGGEELGDARAGVEAEDVGVADVEDDDDLQERSWQGREGASERRCAGGVGAHRVVVGEFPKLTDLLGRRALLLTP